MFKQLLKHYENTLSTEGLESSKSLVLHVQGDFISEVSPQFHLSYQNLTAKPEK